MQDSFYMVRYRTDMYEWGRGWLSGSQAGKWQAWLDEQSTKWHYRFNIILPKNTWGCHQLYTVYSIVYLHPMSSLVRLHNEKEVAEFKKMLTDLCEFCGGKVEFNVQKVNYELEV